MLIKNIDEQIFDVELINELNIFVMRFGVVFLSACVDVPIFESVHFRTNTYGA